MRRLFGDDTFFPSIEPAPYSVYKSRCYFNHSALLVSIFISVYPIANINKNLCKILNEHQNTDIKPVNNQLIIRKTSVKYKNSQILRYNVYET